MRLIVFKNRFSYASMVLFITSFYIYEFIKRLGISDSITLRQPYTYKYEWYVWKCKPEITFP